MKAATAELTELPMRRELFVADTSAGAIELARPYVEKKYDATLLGEAGGAQDTPERQEVVEEGGHPVTR